MMDPKPDSPSDTLILRRRMIETQIRARGIADERILSAMEQLPRECFLPEDLQSQAYEDRALPVGKDQTISQPYIVAFMTEQLAPTPDAIVLEIGTGTGYQTALLAKLCCRVFSVERIDDLRQRADNLLQSMNMGHVSIHSGDGSLGLPAFAPFDRILVTAGAPTIPAPLVDQLGDPGILVIPVGDAKRQTIVRLSKKKGRVTEKALLPCRFVKLVGHRAWPTDPGLAGPQPQP